MTLSTQLARGTLALPLLLLFALLGTTVESTPMDPVQVVEAQLLSSLCPPAAAPHTLVLAQAPADLGQFVIRWGGRPCRA